MGSWFFARERVEDVLEDIGAANPRVTYVGRPEAASPATGSLRRHTTEQEKLVDEALTLPAKKPARAPRKAPVKKSVRAKRS